MSTPVTPLSVEEIRDAFEYDPATGIVRWKVNARPHGRIGEVAGHRTAQGYLRLQYRGRKILVHRIAWAVGMGRWPSCLLDHKNMDKSDNRLDNLREASFSENNANTKTLAKHGFKGVTYNKALRKWHAKIGGTKRSTYLGSYDTAEEAHQAYKSAANDWFGEFARTN